MLFTAFAINRGDNTVKYQSFIEDRILKLMSTETFMTNQEQTGKRAIDSLRVDLHCHSTCSDGTLTPEELVLRADNFQINLLALTDHDTVDGIERARQQIAHQNLNIELITGVEFSTAWSGFDIHIVGLNFDENHEAILNLVKSQQNARFERSKKIAEKLEKAGIADCFEEASQLAKGASITRTHFAKILLNRGIVHTMQKAFDKYLGKGKRAFVKPVWCSIEEAVSAIHQAGGQAVLAHPARYDLSAKWLRRLIVHFSEAGGNGLEAVLPQMNNQQRANMLNYCLEYNLDISVGSDFHAPSRWIELGRNLNLPQTMPQNCVPVWHRWLLN